MKELRPNRSTRIRGLAIGGVAAAFCLLVGGMMANEARAEVDFGIEVVDGSVSDATGNAYTQAGGHPYEATVDFDLRRGVDNEGVFDPGGTLRNVSVDLPPGLVGNVTQLPGCSSVQRLVPEDPLDFDQWCPISSIVGSAEVRVPGFPGEVEVFASPVYSITPPPGVPARFGFAIFPGAVPVVLDASVRSGDDYRITIGSVSTAETVTPLGVSISLWGDPSDSRHDDLRCQYGVLPLPIPICPGGMPIIDPHPYPQGSPEVAMITNPTRCTGPGVGLETTLSVKSYQGDTDTANFESHLPPHYPAPPEDWGDPIGPTGCEDVPFDPQIEIEPLNERADEPTGLSVDLSIPQDGLLSPDGLASAHLKRAEVTLPEGMAISSSSADGLEACSPQQIGLVSTDPIRFDEEDPACPDASKIGGVEIETPLLDEDLSGDVYLAEQGSNPFGSTFAMYLVAEAAGVMVKLPGLVSPDQETGRITATFDDNPQLPFTNLEMRLFGGDRAPLVNPSTCGTKTVEAEFTPWSAADPDNPSSAEIRSRTSSFVIDEGPGGGACASTRGELGFDPELAAGTANPVAGDFSPFAMRLTRGDGQRDIRRVNLTLPEGLTGKLAGIPYCSESALAELGSSARTEPGTAQAEIDDPSCPAASQVGQLVVGSGAGSNPFYLDTGRVYLGGPYRGAPLSLVIVTSVKAGPFDLGNVTVRSALHVNDRTAQIEVRSDEIPTILEGVPLKIRDLRVMADREEFTLNPTNCTPMQVAAGVVGSGDTSASLTNRFQVGDCAALDFAPRFGMRIMNRGRRSTLRSFNPTMRFGVAGRPGDANISRAAVTLPRSIILDQSNIRTTCTRPDFAARECPREAIYGWARAFSPLLDDPIAGPVYLGSSSNPLPDLIADMRGQVRIVLQGRIVGTPDGRMRNIFDVAPDVPVDRFQLQMMGGSERGILVNSTDLCRSPSRGVTNFRGQNSKRNVTRPRVGLTFRGCRQVRQRIAQRHAQRRAAMRKAVRAGKITPAQARRAVRR